MFNVGNSVLALELVALLGRVVDCAFYVAYDPCVISMACKLLLLWPGRCGASMVWTMCLHMLVSMLYLC
jgi:hypothetical protein